MLTYLALGDSYTIGEQVEAAENFPHQTVDILKHQYKIEVAAPKIIAVTGWTTDELNAAIKTENIQQSFDIVTLLIGVNNQYRGRDTGSTGATHHHCAESVGSAGSGARCASHRGRNAEYHGGESGAGRQFGRKPGHGG